MCFLRFKKQKVVSLDFRERTEAENVVSILTFLKNFRDFEN